MIQFEPIGYIMTPYKDQVPRQVMDDDGQFYLLISKEYESALAELERFNYIYVLFYLDRTTKELKMRVNPPYLTNKQVGLFASRTPHRPNPIGLSIVKLIKIENNRLFISGIDALDKTPILDLKPYFQGLDNKDDANSGWIDKVDNSKVNDNTIYLYTDGSCYKNPGPGGYAAIIRKGNEEKIITGYAADTTNNRMELRAIIEGLKNINKNADVKLFSDSNYALNGLNFWIEGWKQKGWKTTNNKSVKNRDLWQELDSLACDYQIELIKVKGHSGHEYNERVDLLAKEQIELNKREG